MGGMNNRDSAPASAVRLARDFLLANREDYAAARSGFAWPRLETFNFALDWFDPIALGQDRDALRVAFEDGSVARRSYAALSEASNRLANYLNKRGVRRGDAVLLMLGNVPELWECMLAIAKLGAVMIPTAPLISAAELRERIARGGVRFVIADAGFADRFDAVRSWTGFTVGDTVPGWLPLAEAEGAPAAFAPDGVTRASDPLLLYFTSGTTAKPKLVLHSHVSYPVGHLSTMYWVGLKPGDVHLNISSPGWAKHAWSCVFAPWLAEAMVLVLNHDRFDAERTLDVIVDQGATTFCAPPTVWRMLVQQDLSRWPIRLRELVSAGEPLNPEIIHHVGKVWGLTIRDGFGQTETSALIGNTPGQPLAEGSMGRPLPGFEVCLKDADGADATEGEICLRLGEARPLGLMQGYRQEENTVAITGDFYRTGDIAACDEEGRYTYVGRADDVFKASDYRISPFELESVLIEHPAVAEAAVVPSPDPTRLAVPKAFVTLAPGHAPSAELAAEILARANKALGPFKRIRLIEFGDLPKTISGKIRRVELRTTEARNKAGGVRGPQEWSEADLARIPRTSADR
jgi:acetyl-CoA synthetase